MFKKRELHIIEVDRATKLPELTADLRESLKTLSFQPAFNYLVQRFRIQRASLEASLHNGYALEEREMRYLQAGIFWLNYLDSEVKKLTANAVPPRAATQPELDEFNQVHRQMELVGE